MNKHSADWKLDSIRFFPNDRKAELIYRKKGLFFSSKRAVVFQGEAYNDLVDAFNAGENVFDKLYK